MMMMMMTYLSIMLHVNSENSFELRSMLGSIYAKLHNAVVACTYSVCILGVRAETGSRTAGSQGYENEGVRGLKALGVRELSYRLAFLACHVAPTNPRVRSHVHSRSSQSQLRDYNELWCVFSLVGRRSAMRSKQLRASRTRCQ